MAKTYTQGDTIALLITATGANIALSEYDISTVIYSMGRQAVVCASTSPVKGEIEIVLRDDTQYGITIPSEGTALMRQGDYLIQTTYRHKTTAVQRTVTNELFSITSKIHCNEHGK